MKTKLLTLIAISLALISCTSRPYDGSTTSSSQSNNNNTTPPPGNSVNAASCNIFSYAGSNITGAVKAYYNAGGIYDSRWVRVRFTTIPTNFGASDNYYIQFFRWRVSPNGNVELDPTPLRFRLEDRFTLTAASS